MTSHSKIGQFNWECIGRLRRRSTVVRLLGLWVRIPPGPWMFVCCECCVCCKVEFSARSRSVLQMSPTGVSFSVIYKPQEWGSHSPRWAAALRGGGLKLKLVQQLQFPFLSNFISHFRWQPACSLHMPWAQIAKCLWEPIYISNKIRRDQNSNRCRSNKYWPMPYGFEDS